MSDEKTIASALRWGSVRPPLRTRELCITRRQETCGWAPFGRRTSSRLLERSLKRPDPSLILQHGRGEYFLLFLFQCPVVTIPELDPARKENGAFSRGPG